MVDVSKGRAKDFLLDGQWQTVPEARTLVMGPGMMMFIFLIIRMMGHLEEFAIRTQCVANEVFGPCCQVDGLVSGFPCTSASALNMCAKGFRDTSSATGCGFKSVTGFIKKFKPAWAILENVKTLCHSRKVDGGKKPIDFIMASMAKLGYLTAYEVVNSMTFGLPQSRTRCWMLFIRLDALKDSMGDPRQSLLSTFRKFQMQYCCLTKVLVGGPEDPPKMCHSSNAAKTKWHKKFQEAKDELGAATWFSEVMVKILFF